MVYSLDHCHGSSWSFFAQNMQAWVLGCFSLQVIWLRARQALTSLLLTGKPSMKAESERGTDKSVVDWEAIHEGWEWERHWQVCCWLGSHPWRLRVREALTSLLLTGKPSMKAESERGTDKSVVDWEAIHEGWEWERHWQVCCWLGSHPWRLRVREALTSLLLTGKPSMKAESERGTDKSVVDWEAIHEGWEWERHWQVCCWLGSHPWSLYATLPQTSTCQGSNSRNAVQYSPSVSPTALCNQASVVILSL